MKLKRLISKNIAERFKNMGTAYDD